VFRFVRAARVARARRIARGASRIAAAVHDARRRSSLSIAASRPHPPRSAQAHVPLALGVLGLAAYHTSRPGSFLLLQMLWPGVALYFADKARLAAPRRAFGRSAFASTR
jgi:hypothetical protein